VPSFGLALAVLFAFAASASASATINPLGSKLKMAGTKVEFNFGSSVIVCESGEAAGSIPFPAAAEAPLENPTFGSGGKECTTTGMEGAKFSVVGNSDSSVHFGLLALSTTSGALRLPGNNENGGGLEFVSGKCNVSAKADSPAGVWANGTSKVPSTLTLSSVQVFLHDNLAENEKTCPPVLVSDLKKHSPELMNFTAKFTVTDTTFPTEPVIFK
jgi:formylmethanofuran dehydrogenase subunit C